VTTVDAQLRAAHENALVVPRPDLAVITVTGEDRASWLNGLVTCDVAKLERGAARYGLVVTQKGRIVTDLFVVCGKDALFVVVPARARDAIVATLEKYLVMEDAEMTKDESLRVWIAHGPKASAIEGAAPCDVTGLGGAVIVARELDASALTLGDRDGWEALRLERGVPEFGIDFDDKTYPQEASLEKRAVSFDKGCYLGQEVVCMLELRGHVKRKLVPFVAEASAAASIARGSAVTDDAGGEVGSISSAIDSNGRAVGLAMIKLAHAGAGTKLHVGSAAITIGDPSGSAAASRSDPNRAASP